MEQETLPVDEWKIRVKTLVVAFDEALGLPPFNKPSPEALAAAEAIREALEVLKRVGLMEVCLKDLEEANYTFPILCAAVPQGSQGSVNIPLYRSLISCLACIAPISKYPLDAVIKDAKELLSYEDVAFFNLLSEANALTEEHVANFLKILPSVEDKKKGVGKKTKGNTKNGPPISEEETGLNAKEYGLSTRIPPLPIRLAVFSSPKLSVALRNTACSAINSTKKFEGFCRGGEQALAESLFRNGYANELIKVLLPTALIPVLSGSLWPWFVELVHKQNSTDLIATLPNGAKNAVRAWEESQFLDIIAAAKKTPSTDKKFPWGSYIATMFLYQCSVLRSSGTDSCSNDQSLVVDIFRKCAVLMKKKNSKNGETVSLCNWLEAMDCFFRFLMEEGITKNVNSTLVTLKKHFTAISLFHAQVLDDFKGRLCAMHQDPSNKKPVPENASNKNSKNSGKTKGKAKNEKDSKPVAPVEPVTNKNTAFCETVIHQFFRVLYAIENVVVSLTRDKKVESLQVVLEGLSVLQKNQKLSSVNALEGLSVQGWRLFLEHMASLSRSSVAPTHQSSSTAVSSSSTLPTSSFLFQCLTRATKTTRSIYWMVPFLISTELPLSGTGITPCATWVKAWPTSLLLEAVSAFFMRVSVLHQPVILGLLFYTITSAQKTLLLNALDQAQDLLTVQRFIESSNSDSDGQWLDERFSVCAKEGLSELSVGLSDRIKTNEERSVEEKKAKMEREAAQVHQRMLQEEAWARENAALHEAAAKREALFLRQQEQIKQTIQFEREKKEKKARLAEEERQRQMQIAARVAAEIKSRSAKEREVERKKKLQTYKEASVRAFRATTFLHSIGLPSSQVMKVVNTVVVKKPDVMPDDLLEYLVTGVASIPNDMMEEDEEDEQADGTDQKATEQSRNSFWQDVLESTAEQEAAKKVAEQNTHSFHYRMSPFLDLFCYEGGNEFGQLPDPLPRISLKVAKKLVPQERFERSGYPSLTDAFHLLAVKKLVRLSDHMAELTVLGFRYHFPFHNPEQMLQVLVASQKAKALAILQAVRQRASEQKITTAPAKSGSHAGYELENGEDVSNSEEDEEEYEESFNSEETEEDEVESDNQV